MPTFIKTGYWERTSKSLKGWLNLDNLVRDIASSVVTTDEIGAIKGANSPSPANPFATMNDIGGGGNTCADFIQSNTSAYTVVCTNDSPTDNGTALLAAYAAAKALTPNGEELSATNRACVIIPPGNYDLDHGEDDACVPLTLDAEFVDIIGLTTDRELQHIYGTPPVTNSGVIIQTANDVHISNLTVEILTEGAELNWNNDSAAYFPSTNLALTKVDNCEFIGMGGGSNVLFSMRIGLLEYSGTFTNCTGGDYAFGGSEGTASGIFNNCTGRDFAFGGDGTASGTFNYCTGGVASFGGGGTASGIFNNCTGGEAAFGNGGTASGVFTNCTGRDYAFGSEGTASGTFNYCTGGEAAFGGVGGVLSGKLYYCRLTVGSFQTLAEGGKLRACIDGSDTFIATLDYGAP